MSTYQACVIVNHFLPAEGKCVYPRCDATPTHRIVYRGTMGSSVKEGENGSVLCSRHAPAIRRLAGVELEPISR